MKVILVVGAWGSGTTALIGALDRLGVSTFGPHFKTNDPKTENSFELLAFRDLILRHVDEPSVSLIEERATQLPAALVEFRDALAAGRFGEWPPGRPKRVALKVPLASICLPQIAAALDPTVLLVHRPFRDIEATRRRRRWLAYMGPKGANRIYTKAISDLIAIGRSFLAVSYTDLVTEPARTLETVIEFCDLEDLRQNIDAAAGFIRKS